MTAGHSQPDPSVATAAPAPSVATAAPPDRTERAPASDEIVEVAPGILRMQLPAPLLTIGHVNMYGLVDRHGLAVVDPGMPGPTAWKAVHQRLRRAGFSVRDVHTVVITHSHIDHYGGAGHLARKARAAVVAHDAFTVPMQDSWPARVTGRFAAARVEREIASIASVGDDEFVRDSDDPFTGPDARAHQRAQHPGVRHRPWGERSDPRMARRLLAHRLASLLSGLPHPTRRVRNGDRIEIGGREWTCVHTPGHTVDHLCLFDRDSGVFLSGDHVLPTVSSLIHGIPGGVDALGAYVSSLALVGSLEGVRLGLPAHGGTIADVAGRVATVQRHLARRGDRVLAATHALGSPTAVEVGDEIVSGRKSPWSAGIAYVHLEHLCAIGAVERVDSDGMPRYRATGSGAG